MSNPTIRVRYPRQFVLESLPKITFMVFGFTTSSCDPKRIAYSWTIILLPTSSLIYFRYINNPEENFNKVIWIQIFSHGVLVFNLLAIFVHMSVLCFRHHVISSEIFEKERYLSAFGSFDFFVLLVAFSSYFTTYNTPGTFRFWIILMIRCHLMFTNYLIASQFCAVLKYHQKKIESLTRDFKDRSKWDVASVERSIAKFDNALFSLMSLNGYFGYQMLCVIAGISGNLSVVSFYLVNYLLTARKYDFSRLCIFTSGCAIRLLVLVYVNTYCDKALKAVEEFYSVMFLVIRGDNDLSRSRKLRLFVELKKTAHFTAGGFFHLGNYVITSTIAAATTYFVVLIQFAS